MKTVILGGSGFIGSSLGRNLGESSVSLGRDDLLNFFERPMALEPLCVINCLSSQNLRNKEDINFVNYELPRRFALLPQVHTWIQLSSYYSEYKVKFGLDFNWYSETKDKFSQYLEEKADFSVIDYVVPHIFAPTENVKRIVSRLVVSHINNMSASVISLHQEIPILELHRLVEVITKRVRGESLKQYERSRLTASCILKVNDFIHFLQEETGNRPRILEENPSNSRYFQTIDWPATFIDGQNKYREILFAYEKHLQKSVNTKDGLHA